MGRQKKDFRLGLKKALLKKMDIKIPKTDLKLEEDPFLRLGKIPGFNLEQLMAPWYFIYGLSLKYGVTKLGFVIINAEL